MMKNSKNLVHFEDSNYYDILKQTNKKCFYCGRYSEYFHIEDTRNEYSLHFDEIPVCDRCHTIKKEMSIYEFKKYLLDTVSKLKDQFELSILFELELLQRTDKHVIFYGERISNSLVTDREIIKNIKKQVAEFYNLKEKDLDIPTRKRDIVWARQVAHLFSRNKSGASLEFIANEIGRIDHATVMHSIKTVRNIYDTDPKKRKEIDFLSRVFDAVI